VLQKRKNEIESELAALKKSSSENETNSKVQVLKLEMELKDQKSAYDKLREDTVQINTELKALQKDKERLERELYAINANKDANLELVEKLRQEVREKEVEVRE